jgi:hypothetical protein
MERNLFQNAAGKTENGHSQQEYRDPFFHKNTASPL